MRPIFTGILLAILFSINGNSQQIECIDSLYNNKGYFEYYEKLFPGKLFLRDTDWEKGYVIMAQGDTLFGQLKIYKDGISIGFRKHINEERIRADKYQSFKFGNRYFVSKKFQGYPFNAELIETGAINLYAYQQHSTISFSGLIMPVNLLDFYLEKGSVLYGPFRLKWTDKIIYKSWLNECFGDCEYLMTKIENKTINYSELLRLCRAYNCWALQTEHATKPTSENDSSNLAH